MEHRERHRPAESPVVERHRRGIGLDDIDVRAGQARGKRGGQPGVDLDGGQLGDPGPEQIGRQPWSRTDLEHVVAEVSRCELSKRERQGTIFERLAPLVSAEAIEVQLIHVQTVDTPPRCRRLEHSRLGKESA